MDLMIQINGLIELDILKFDLDVVMSDLDQWIKKLISDKEIAYG